MLATVLQEKELLERICYPSRPLRVCVIGVEFGWTAWQKGVGHPGPVESSLLYSSEGSWLAGSHLLMPLHLWVLAGRCPSREKVVQGSGAKHGLHCQSHLGVRSPAAGPGTLAFSPESESNRQTRCLGRCDV